MRISIFRFKFYWDLFARCQLTITHHWIKYCLRTEEAPSQYLNRWWSSFLTHIYVIRLCGVVTTSDFPNHNRHPISHRCRSVACSMLLLVTVVLRVKQCYIEPCYNDTRMWKPPVLIDGASLPLSRPKLLHNIWLNTKYMCELYWSDSAICHGRVFIITFSHWEMRISHALWSTPGRPHLNTNTSFSIFHSFSTIY